MRIHGKFPGGNIEVLENNGAEILLRNELRDTIGDWFYWAFCVEGAQGQTLTFRLDKKWIGYYGPAVSHDLVSWKWLWEEGIDTAADTFTYSFWPEETRVYFAHNMLYHPAHFDAFCSRLGLRQETVCRSEHGLPVPGVRFGEGPERILLSARHHACESTGDYVLEGVLESLFRNPIPGLEVVAVPFVDLDGVVNGDQGKSRAPYDHNRDYDPNGASIYASVRALRRLAAEKPLRYALDFHSPWHLSGLNDHVYIPQKHYDILKNLTRFANLWEASQTDAALPYHVSNTLPPDTDWNVAGTPCFGTYMHSTAGAELSCTVETPYFRCSGVPFSPDKARELGRCLAEGLRKYHARSPKISFTGDILYNGAINLQCETGEGRNYMPLLREVWNRLPDTDWLVGNLETPVAGADNEGYTHERWRFNTPEEALTALRKTGFDMVTLANNHCMDRGFPGLQATVAACRNAGLDTTGAYLSPQERNEPCVREIGGIRVGFVNATYGTNAFSHRTFLRPEEAFAVRLTQPEETLPGSIHLLEPEEAIAAKTEATYGGGSADPLCQPYLDDLRDILTRTKEQCDFLFMLLHSGGQYNIRPDAYTRMLVEKCRSWGADMVVCNHPHIILPCSAEEGAFTAYCLGNLLDGNPGYTRPGCPICPDFSAVLNVTLTREGGAVAPQVSFRIFHTLFDPDGVRPPRVEDTFERWKQQPSDAYAETILYYANRFMPGMRYTQVQPEYPVTL